MLFRSALTLASTTTVTTTMYHNFVVGQEVAFRIPSQWGTSQLNSLPNVIIPGSQIYGYVVSVTDNWTVAGGWYRNSEYHGSTYAYGRYSFYKKDQWDLGIGIGAVTGYTTMKVMPMAFPEACYSWICAIFVPKIEPTGADVLALRARIPIQ